MDLSVIPSTVYVAFGVITAALLTGFFSIMNMVSAKENKVSEFRLGWVDGLRNEISEYTAAAQEISRAIRPGRFKPEQFHTAQEAHELQIEFFKETKDCYAKAAENLSRIQLRLNPEHISQNPDGPEAKLMAAVSKARRLGNKEFKEVLECCEEIRTAAAPILKSTWNSIKRGELGYRRIRLAGLMTVFFGFYLIIGVGGYLGWVSYNGRPHEHRAIQLPLPTPVQNCIPRTLPCAPQEISPSRLNRQHRTDNTN
jgi:hypothetical protein